MEPTSTVTSRSLLVLGTMIFLLLLSVVVPASWIGVKPKHYTKLNLGLDDLTPISKLKGDNNNNQVPDWRELAANSLGTSTEEKVRTIRVDEATKKKLEDPNNLTASFSKNLYMASAYLKQNGTEGVNQETLIKNLMNEESKKIVIKQYTVNDLYLIKKPTQEDKKAYGNALGAIIKKAANYKLGEGDTEIMQSYLKNKNPKDLIPFITKRDRADTLITAMLATRVPVSAVPYHLLALNRASEYRSMIDSFAGADSDPVKATISFEGYTSNIKALKAALINLSSYFESENVVFTKNEAGYLFTVGYTFNN